MVKLKLYDVRKYVEKNIDGFHKPRINKLKELKLSDILLKKNPYLFRAKNILSAQDLVQVIVDAYISSQEETIFGTFLEGLAIFVCEKVFNGKKSAAEGIDLEFQRDGIIYIVTIKSGTNWGNGSQISKMKEDFRKAKKILGTNTSKKNIVAVNGCCYGRINKIDKGEYQKIAGQKFWEFISGSPNLYIEIVEPLGHQAKERNNEFINSYYQLLNQFTLQFANEFCIDGKIDWDKLLKFNSGKDKIKVNI